MNILIKISKSGIFKRYQAKFVSNMFIVTYNLAFMVSNAI